jgi:NADPH-dependent 2,4-dienoyl-CoA reductase/sulfur reductase-like enzyme
MSRLVIVGGGLAAQRCCETLRAAGDDRPITILSAEPVRPYDRPPLSKDALAGEADVAFRPLEWYAANGIELRLGAVAAALDPVRREVVLAGDLATGSRDAAHRDGVVAGGERVRYDDLLIATGARALMLPMLAPFANVQALRTLADAQRLRAAVAAGGPLAVVGAGLIGLEAAATAARAGIDVTVIEAAPRPLAGVLGPRAAAWLTARHRAAGVAVRLGTTVVAAHGNGAVEELELADGARVPCAHVLVGVGVRPALEWVAGSGLDPAGIAVDEQGRTALPHVFAAGDATGGGHWEAASRGGAAVAGTLLGRPARPPAPPQFWTDQHDVRLVCVGDPRDAREVVAHGDLAPAGDPAAVSFELDHIRDGRLTAVLLANRPPSALRAARGRLSDEPAIPERNAA